MLAVSSHNTISSLISKALSDDSISDEEYSLILLEFETITRIKEDLREKSKTSLEKTGNTETEANELLRGNKIDVLTSIVFVFETVFKNHVQTSIQNRIQNRIQKSVKK